MSDSQTCSLSIKEEIIRGDGELHACLLLSQRVWSIHCLDDSVSALRSLDVEIAIIPLQMLTELARIPIRC
jgi:hypothetical protein